MNDNRQKLRLWVAMLRSYRTIQKDLREKLRGEFGMTLPQFQVMAQLANHPDGVGMSALADSLLLSNANVSGIIERMAREGWIIRQSPEDDKRSIKVRLGQEGWNAFDQVMSKYGDWVDQLFADFDADEIDQLLGAHRRLVKRPPLD